MKRSFKITTWAIAAIILLLRGIIGGPFLKDYLYEIWNPPFEETTIFPDDGRENPADTTFTVNGIEIKMIGSRSMSTSIMTTA